MGNADGSEKRAIGVAGDQVVVAAAHCAKIGVSAKKCRVATRHYSPDVPGAPRGPFSGAKNKLMATNMLSTNKH
jgi:hypothetical protein